MTFIPVLTAAPRFLRALLVSFAAAMSACAGASPTRFERMPELVPEPASLSDTGLDWQKAMDTLGDQLVRNLRAPSEIPVKLALFDLTSPQGGLCTLGFSIEEELTTRLFRSKRFNLVERKQLSTVMAEQRMRSTEAVDPRNAAKLGRLLGAQAVLAGTAMHTADGYRILPKIILVETAEIISVAESNVAAAVAEKHGACERMRVDPPRLGVDGRDPTWVQDFKHVPIGGAPDDWLGTEHYTVRDDLRGRRFFTCRDSGPARFTIPVHDVPDDYRVEVAFTWVRASTMLTLQFGPVRVGLGPDGDALLNQLQRKISPAPTLDAPITLAIEKRRSVFRLLIDGREVIFARLLNIAPADSIILDLNAGGYVDCANGSVIVHEVRVRRAMG
jgi:TolB-like protein